MARNGQWERVEPHLYRLKHQTPQGEWIMRYYVRFKDWKGVSRTFPAGTDLRGARSKKKLLLGENERRVDFDTEKCLQRITFTSGRTATWSWPRGKGPSRMMFISWDSFAQSLALCHWRRSPTPIQQALP